MTCSTCGRKASLWSKNRSGTQLYRCRPCNRTWTEPRPKSPIHPMRIPFECAVLCLNLLVEGNSIRATERITGTHRDTICRLLALAGGKAERLLADLIQDVPIENVEADELWAFVEMKQKTKNRKGIKDPEVGDSYTFLASDADSKLILAHQVGQRTAPHADAFCEKLDRATAGRFQLSTDGWNGFPEPIAYHLGTRTDYAMLVKEFGMESGEERRYSPPRIIAATKTPIHGKPDEDRICTSHAERLNLDVRMKNRRFTRLTNGFSKLFRNHRASVALTVAHYNLCKMHRSIRMTPAMKAGLTNRVWSVGDLLAA